MAGRVVLTHPSGRFTVDVGELRGNVLRSRGYRSVEPPAVTPSVEGDSTEITVPSTPRPTTKRRARGNR